MKTKSLLKTTILSFFRYIMLNRYRDIWPGYSFFLFYFFCKIKNIYICILLIQCFFYMFVSHSLFYWIFQKCIRAWLPDWLHFFSFFRNIFVNWTVLSSPFKLDQYFKIHCVWSNKMRWNKLILCEI